MCQSFKKLHCNHRQTSCPRNRPRNRTTDVTERRNQQNPIHPLKNFKIFSNDPETKYIFPPPPLILFKREENMGNFLVKSAFKSYNQPGTFKCERTRYKTCPFISNMIKILGPNRSAKITDNLTCISVNVIYCIACMLC